MHIVEIVRSNRKPNMSVLSAYIDAIYLSLEICSSTASNRMGL